MASMTPKKTKQTNKKQYYKSQGLSPKTFLKEWIIHIFRNLEMVPLLPLLKVDRKTSFPFVKDFSSTKGEILEKFKIFP